MTATPSGAPTARVGRYRLGRFLVVVVPALLAALLLLPAIVLGWVPISIATAKPMGIGVSSGDAESLHVSLAADRSLAPRRATDDARGAVLLHLTQGDLADLCLDLDLPLPFMPDVPVQVRSEEPVQLGMITLAVAEGDLGGLELPPAELGVMGGGEAASVPAGNAGAFVLRTGEGTHHFEELSSDTYALRLDDGLRLDALGLRGGLDAPTC